MEDVLKKIERNFQELIMQQCGGLRLFDEYLKENPDFEFPKITENLLKLNNQSFVAIPGMFGGFAYYLEKVNDSPILYVELSSRMDYSSDDYSYFEIAENGSKTLKGEERKMVAQKFRDLSKNATERHKEELRKNEGQV